ncbi:hypothetical protein [Polaromonas sp.]|uniref:hypothetical protein n=1 Tax=Polaromonas sp. TaxID=1869339 RepID=UPI003BAC8037
MVIFFRQRDDIINQVTQTCAANSGINDNQSSELASDPAGLTSKCSQPESVPGPLLTGSAKSVLAMLTGQHAETALKMSDFQRKIREQFLTLAGFQHLFPGLFPGFALAASEFH